MKRMITLFGVAVMAVFAFTAISAAIASAELTKILPEPTAGAPLTDTATQSAAGRLLALKGLEIKCTKGSGKETWTSANNGSGGVLFEGCTSALSTTCTGAGDTTGDIPANGETRFWLALQMEAGGASKLIAALVFLIKPAITFTCVNSGKTIKNEIVVQENSCIAAKDLNINSLISTENEEFQEFTSGETSILSVLPAEATNEIKCLPLERLNAAASELFAVQANFAISEYKKSNAALTIELMN
jgi:hypothetical protein